MPLQTDPAEPSALYECRNCQARIEDPDGRRCDCGGDLQNIGVPRPE